MAGFGCTVNIASFNANKTRFANRLIRQGLDLQLTVMVSVQTHESTRDRTMPAITASASRNHEVRMMFFTLVGLVRLQRNGAGQR